MKLFYFDLETTGVKHWVHSIHQISGCIEIDGVVKENFDIRMKPHPQAKIDPTALLISGITEEDFATDRYIPMVDAYNIIIKLVSKYVDRYNRAYKFFLIGYNNQGFDNNFFRAFFLHNRDDYFGSYFWSNSIDVMVLAAQMLMKDRPKMIDFKQGTVATYLGIKVDETKLHDAEYDTYILRQIYAKVTNGTIFTPPVLGKTYSGDSEDVVLGTLNGMDDLM